MTDDRKTSALRQLANIVIDAYLNRDQQFVPTFDQFEGVQARIYLSRDENDHPALRPGVWYEKSDYEAPVTPREQKAQRTPQQ